MLNGIKKVATKIVETVKNTEKVFNDTLKPTRLTNKEIEDHINIHTPLIKNAVSIRTGVDLYDIPFEFVQTVDNVAYECLAAYTCRAEAPLFSFGERHLCKTAADEVIQINMSNLTKLVLPKRTFYMVLDQIIAHELFHAADARRDSTVYTEVDPFESGQSRKEQYTDWRAIECVCEVLYPTPSAQLQLNALRLMNNELTSKFRKLPNKWTASAKEIA